MTSDAPAGHAARHRRAAADGAAVRGGPRWSPAVVKSRCSQSSTELLSIHRPFLTKRACTLWAVNILKVFKNQGGTCILGLFFQPVCYLFCIRSHVNFTDTGLKKKRVFGHLDTFLECHHVLILRHQMTQTRPCLQPFRFFVFLFFFKFRSF